MGEYLKKAKELAVKYGLSYDIPTINSLLTERDYLEFGDYFFAHIDRMKYLVQVDEVLKKLKTKVTLVLFKNILIRDIDKLACMDDEWLHEYEKEKNRIIKVVRDNYINIDSTEISSDLLYDSMVNDIVVEEIQRIESNTLRLTL